MKSGKTTLFLLKGKSINKAREEERGIIDGHMFGKATRQAQRELSGGPKRERR